MEHEKEDNAEKVAQGQRNRDGKYMLLAGLVVVAAITADGLSRWIFGRPMPSGVVKWILASVVIFVSGCASNWIGTEFQELHARTKEISERLAELRAAIEELKGGS